MRLQLLPHALHACLPENTSHTCSTQPCPAGTEKFCLRAAEGTAAAWMAFAIAYACLPSACFWTRADASQLFLSDFISEATAQAGTPESHDYDHWFVAGRGDAGLDRGRLGKDACKEIPAAEIALHTKPDDCWVVIKGKVYDVSGWGKDHPGGAVIYTYGGKVRISVSALRLASLTSALMAALLRALNRTRQTCFLPSTREALGGSCESG